MKTNFGKLNPHHVGLVMREAVRQAIIEIRNQRFTFSSEVKFVSYKKEQDLVTSADFAAQNIFLKIIKENFPKAGIVAEEDFACKCTDPDHDYYFTIDPLDGTKAYGRRQSHAIATMISFIFDGEICGATIGDVMTQEIFHTRPGSSKVHRISEFQTAEILKHIKKPLKDQYLQLRQDPRSYSTFAQLVTSPSCEIKPFSGIEVMGGSIGFMFARLWKGEIGGLLLEPGKQSPWDAMPVVGISQKLGYIFLKVPPHPSYEIMDYKASDKIQKFDHETLVIHKSNLRELELLT